VRQLSTWYLDWDANEDSSEEKERPLLLAAPSSTASGARTQWLAWPLYLFPCVLHQQVIIWESKPQQQVVLAAAQMCTSQRVRTDQATPAGKCMLPGWLASSSTGRRVAW